MKVGMIMYVWPNGIPHRGRRGRRYGRLSPSSLTVAEPCVIDEKGKKITRGRGECVHDGIAAISGVICTDRRYRCRYAR